MDCIPKDWSWKPLKQLFEFKNGVNADKGSYGQGVKFINIMEVIENDVITESKIPGSVTLEKRVIDQNLVKYGDILFNRTSETPEEIGLSAVYFGRSTVTFGGFVIRGKSKNEELDISFKKYCFNSFEVRKQIIRRGQGAVRANIGQKDLEKVELPVPSIEEQKAIANVLSIWDNAIEILAHLITQKQLKKKALMQQMLTRRKRLPASVSASAGILGIDRDWEEVKLGDFFKERKETNRSDLTLLSVGSRGVYPQSESDKKDTSNVDKSKYKRICKGDIGYNTMRMWQGRSALSELEGIVSPAYTIVTPKENADVRFFSYLFQVPNVIHRFYRNSQGLVNDTLNCKFKDFAMVKVIIPQTKEKQIRIGKVLLQADNEIKILEEKMAHLQSQKKGLMQQLLIGKKRLNIYNKQ
jgi:type I restriction enzyme S subunit